MKKKYLLRESEKLQKYARKIEEIRTRNKQFAIEHNL